MAAATCTMGALPAARADDRIHAPPGTEDDHLELTMGFLAGERDYAKTTFHTSLNEPGAGALVEPFEHAPYDGVNVFGLRYDARLVASYVRMTVGFDLPFTTFEGADTRATYTVLGADRAVSVQSLRPYELRFGIGGEYPLGRVVPFVDLMGAVHWVDTTLSLDGRSVDYATTTFAFSLRAGARIYMRDWFFAQLAGDVGLGGDVRWNAELSLGFATPS